MDCGVIQASRCSWGTGIINFERDSQYLSERTTWRLRNGSFPLIYSSGNYCNPGHRKAKFRKTYCIHLVNDSFSSVRSDEYSNEDDQVPSADPLGQALNTDQLKSLLSDSGRTKLAKKLSEANQQNRFLKRQLQEKEDALLKFKSELAIMELEVQALVTLAKEIARSRIPEGSRKINGKYIQSHLLSRLEVVSEGLKEQIKDVEAAQSKEVTLSWRGMAENVQVMGTFDGWSQGEHLSPEYTDSFTNFSTTLLLRPGRYEIKFLIDGEWHLSPDMPTVGEGLMKNNLLTVE